MMEILSMCRTSIAALAVSVLTLAGVAHAASQAVCRPKLSVSGVHFSEMIRPTMERHWRATVSVDASSCAPNAAGYFEMEFTRYKEIGLDLVFRKQFIWVPPSVLIGLDFGADEAVGHYTIVSITECPCRK
jgi:hypothetical protein